MIKEYNVLTKLAVEVSERMNKGDYKGKTLTLKYKYFDFEQHTRSKTFSFFTNDAGILLDTSMEMLIGDFPEKPIRLLGLGMSNLGDDEDLPPPDQLTIGF